VPEWYLTGLYAFLRTMYDKFVTGVAWPGLFIFALLIVPFIDKYKKFSWKDRPIITALGITSLAQIIVTTYWGFYIDPNFDKALLERLVIDPIFFYLVMILLVPLSFGFSYMMIKLAKHAEANAKLAPKKAKSSINISQKWLFALFVVLLAFQVYLNIAAYYAMLQGMKNFSLFIIGIVMLVFAGMFHLYRYGRTMAKAPPPKPVTPAPLKPSIAPAAKPATVAPVEKPLAAPPTATAKVGSGQSPQLSQQQKQATTGTASTKSATAPDHVQPTRVEGSDRKESA